MRALDFYGTCRSPHFESRYRQIEINLKQRPVITLFQLQFVLVFDIVVRGLLHDLYYFKQCVMILNFWLLSINRYICFKFGEYVGQFKVHESLYSHVLYIIFVIGFGQSQLCPYEASGKL